MGISNVMDFPVEGRRYQLNVPTGLAEALGDKQPLRILRSRDYFVVYETEDDIRDISPDFFALSKMDTVGVIVTAPGKDVDFRSGAFLHLVPVFPKIRLPARLIATFIPTGPKNLEKTNYMPISCQPARGNYGAN